MRWENLLLIPVVIILDVFIGLAIDSIFWAFKGELPILYLILIIAIIDIAGLIGLWNKIQSIFHSIFGD